MSKWNLAIITLVYVTCEECVCGLERECSTNALKLAREALVKAIAYAQGNLGHHHAVIFKQALAALGESSHAP